MKIMVINGPNLNMLGIREPEQYGDKSYSELEKFIEEYFDEKNVEGVVLQSNSEGEIIDFIHHAYGNYDAIVINPAAYTHYSYAIFDALKAVNLPAVEVHLSDIFSREDFRKQSVVAPACIKQISGLGFEGYKCAVDLLLNNAGEIKDEI